MSQPQDELFKCIDAHIVRIKDLEAERDLYKQALQRMLEIGISNYVDETTNLWETRITKEAEIAKEALSKGRTGG